MILQFPKPARRGPRGRSRTARRVPLRSAAPPARQSRPPAMRQTTVSALIREADRLFSRIVLRTQVCEICKERRAVDPAHHISRDYKAVRWTLTNASAACRLCHDTFTVRKAAWRAWWMRKVGMSTAREVIAIANRGVQINEVYMRSVVAALRVA